MKKLRISKTNALTPKTSAVRKVTKSPQALLVVDDNYLPALTQLLNHASKSVDIIAYSFAIGRAAGFYSKKGAPFRIAEQLIALKKKWKAKIKIRLYLEGERDTAERNRLTGDYLKKAGIDVRYGSTHAKGFCIDDSLVLFGSTNLTNQSITKNIGLVMK